MVVSEEYSLSERQSFTLHLAIAVACLPLYYLMPTSFGLLISPYVFFLAVRPKTQYLLPMIIHIAYGSQQRYFFCMGCFIYVLFHARNLYKYRLQILYWLYLFLFPFFVWYVYQKWHGPRYVGGIGEITGGIGEYFVFSTVFWGLLVVKKLNRTVFRGMLVFMLFLLAILSFLGAKDEETGAVVTGINMFSREVFFAMPFLFATFVYYLVKRERKRTFELIVSGSGVVIMCLDFVGVLRMSFTFTNLGGCLLSAIFVFLGAKKHRILVRFFHPLLLFVVSAIIVLLSTSLVEKLGGEYKDEGEYSKMSNTDISSLLKKLQRKAIDDRASVWSMNIAHITKMLKERPIWIDASPEIDGEIYVPGKGMVHAVVIMGAHNTMLALLRNYGFYGGLGLYVLFVWYFCSRTNMRVLLGRANPLVLVLMATCLSQGVVGGHTGHYPVQLGFGPVLFGCLGACWRYYYEWMVRRRPIVPFGYVR